MRRSLKWLWFVPLVLLVQVAAVAGGTPAHSDTIRPVIKSAENSVPAAPRPPAQPGQGRPPLPAAPVRPDRPVAISSVTGDFAATVDTGNGVGDVAYSEWYSEYGFIYTRGGVNVRVYKSDGVPYSDPINVSTTGGRPRMVYNPANDQYLAGWSTTQVTVRVLAYDGTPQGTSVTLPTAVVFGNGLQEIVYNYVDNEYLVLFVDSLGQLRGQRVAAAGTLIGADFVIRATQNGCGDVVYNWIDNRYMVVGDYAADGTDVWGRLLSADGTLIAEVIVETYADDQICPQVAWNPIDNEYLVLWTDNFTGTDDVYGRRLTSSGAVTGAYVLAETDAVMAGRLHDVVFNEGADAFMAGWRDVPPGFDDPTLYYTRLIGRNGEMLGAAEALNNEGVNGSQALDRAQGRRFVVFYSNEALLIATTINNPRGSFMPAIFLPGNGCAPAYPFNETIRFNMANINAPDAWECGITGGGVTIAVVDTGVDLDHVDLVGNMVPGASFVPGVVSADDDNGHGTHVAGSAAAVGNNGGVIGVAPKANIMPVKALDATGSGFFSWIADGIIWAVDNGADIINLSLGGPQGSFTIDSALQYAQNAGVLIVAAAGNCGDGANLSIGCSFEDQPWYPAWRAETIAVAAVDSNNVQSYFSTSGSYVELSAPGESIYSTVSGNGYTTFSGTSQAAPHVAGLAALVWANEPTLTLQQVRDRLTSTAVDLGPAGRDNQYGYGLIDAAAALGLPATTASGGPDSAESPLFPAAYAAPAQFTPGRVLVRFADGLSAAGVLAGLPGGAAMQVARVIQPVGVTVLTVPVGSELATVAALQALDTVLFAEVDGTLYAR